jgi:uncharacterized damage-inducible protein DinB
METSAFIRLLIDQNKNTSSYSFREINPENLRWRLSPGAASVGFMYRHIGEIQLLLGTFLGEATEVSNTTMGFKDTGQGADLEVSHRLVDSGYAMLYDLAEKHGTDWWTEKIETPFFGEIERIRLLGHILNHNAHHAGQIALTLARFPDAR